MTIYSLNPNNLLFPDVNLALDEPNGLLALGGDLNPQRLITAYGKGIFPWYSEGDPILWWSPNPRAVLYIDDLHINRSLKKFLKKSPYKVTLNNAFEKVIEICAHAPNRDDGIWILPEMIESYKKLHKQGVAHSIEVWDDQELVGGLYGIAINGFFSGESMFHLKPNASKQALFALCEYLKSQKINMVDCQILNPFLESMGCCEVSREAFLLDLTHMSKIKLPTDFWQSRDLF